MKKKSKENKSVRWRKLFLKGTAGIARIMTMGLFLNGISPSGADAATNYMDEMDDVELEVGEEDIDFGRNEAFQQQRLDETQRSDELTS